MFLESSVMLSLEWYISIGIAGSMSLSYTTGAWYIGDINCPPESVIVKELLMAIPVRTSHVVGGCVIYLQHFLFLYHFFCWYLFVICNLFFSVNMIKHVWIRRWTGYHRVASSSPTVANVLCSWVRHFTILFIIT